MIWQNVFAPQSLVRPRSEPRKFAEVADNVRLVEISALHCKGRPVRRFVVPQDFPRPLKPPYAGVQFGRQANFGGKHLNEPALTEPDAPGDVAYVCGRALFKRVQRNGYGGMANLRAM